MSTKTLRKRIALVAVSAMGLGLLSVAPASAAATITAISVASPTINRASGTGTVTLVVTSTTAQANDANDTFTARVLSVPTGTANTMEVGDYFQAGALGALATGAETNLTVGAGNQIALDGVATADGDIAGDIADEDPLTVAPRAGVNVANLNDGTDTIVGWTDVAPANGEYDVTTETVPTGVTDDYVNVAGTYSFGVWYDNNGDTVLDAAELATYKVVTITVGGTPTSITITPASTTIAAGVDSYVKVYAYDSGARLTRLTGAEGIRLTASAVTGTATNLLTVEGAAAGDNIDDVVTGDFDTAIGDDRTYVEAFISSDAGGSIKVTGQFFAGPAPLATAATSGTIVVNAASNSTKVVIATAGITTNQYKMVAPAGLSATLGLTDTVYVNAATTRAVSFTISGTAGTNVNVTLGAVTDASDSLTAGTTSVAIGSAGTGTYTVSPDYVTAATTYTVTAPYAAGNLVYTIDFMAPTVDCAAGGCGISTTGIPSGVSKDIKSPAATTSFAVVVKDQFGTAYPYYKVMLTSGTTARNASLDKSAITDASGSATVSYTDASTSTTVLTDALTLSVYAPSDLTTNIFDVGNTITLDYTGTLGSLTLTGGSTATSTVKREVIEATDISETDAAATDNVRLIDNTLLSSTTGAVSGYATTYTGTAGVLFIADTDNDGDIDDEGLVTGLGNISDATSSVIVPNGTQVFVMSTKKGLATITVTSGGLTATANVTFTQVANAANARDIAVSASATGTTGVMSNVTATVTDGHGNALEGATVTFIRSGGRFATGASSVNVTTDANGVAAIDVTSDTAASVTVTASLPVGTHAESDDVAATPVSTYAAASGSKSASIAFTVTTVKSAGELALEALAALTAQIAADKITTDAKIAASQAAAVAAAEAAADAAAEAIDAGNNAYDSANAATDAADAATAAAQQAGEDAVAAAEAAGAAAVEAAQSAQDAAAEATDAATAATDAANAAAEAADAATAAAQCSRCSSCSISTGNRDGCFT